MDLEQLIPLSEETEISVDPTVVTWIYHLSLTVDDCLDQGQACILSVAKMFEKGCQHRTYAFNKIRFSCD